MQHILLSTMLFFAALCIKSPIFASFLSSLSIFWWGPSDGYYVGGCEHHEVKRRRVA